MITFFVLIGSLSITSNVHWREVIDEAMLPSITADSTLTYSSDIDTVWKNVFVNSDNLFVKITKILLWLTITLSVTMILYNGIQYIIQTWQWKEWKDLTKNIAYIVIWIIIALFSVIIITLIQSSTTTLQKELTTGTPDELIN